MRSRFAMALLYRRRTYSLAGLLLALSGCPLEDDDVAPTSNTDPDNGAGELDAGTPDIDPSGDAPDAEVVVVELDAGSEGVDAEIVPVADASVDANLPPELPSLMLCEEMDKRWGVASNGDRALTWGNDVFLAYSTLQYADCRVRAIWAPGDDTDFITYLIGWNLEAFGCASTMDTAVKDQFGLVNTGVDVQYTTADLALLVDTYMAAVNLAIASNVTETPTAKDPLAADKLTALRARLELLAAKKDPTSSTIYSQELATDDCPPP